MEPTAQAVVHIDQSMEAEVSGETGPSEQGVGAVPEGVKGGPVGVVVLGEGGVGGRQLVDVQDVAGSHLLVLAVTPLLLVQAELVHWTMGVLDLPQEHVFIFAEIGSQLFVLLADQLNLLFPAVPAGPLPLQLALQPADFLLQPGHFPPVHLPPDLPVSILLECVGVGHHYLLHSFQQLTRLPVLQHHPLHLAVEFAVQFPLYAAVERLRELLQDVLQVLQVRIRQVLLPIEVVRPATVSLPLPLQLVGGQSLQGDAERDLEGGVLDVSAGWGVRLESGGAVVLGEGRDGVVEAGREGTLGLGGVLRGVGVVGGSAQFAHQRITIHTIRTTQHNLIFNICVRMQNKPIGNRDCLRQAEETHFCWGRLLIFQYCDWYAIPLLHPSEGISPLPSFSVLPKRTTTFPQSPPPKAHP